MNPPAIDRSIDIRQLRYFLVLAEELNFRRAAERLHLTQPPLSRQIAALEAALGVPLLERGSGNGGGTRLTAAGQLARQAFAEAVQGFETALQKVAAAAPQTRQRLRMGLPWWVDMSGFASFELALREQHGLGGIDPVLAPSPELLALLLKQELDVALITMPQELKGLSHSPVARLDHVALVPAASPLARKRALRLRDLEALPAFLRFGKRHNPALWQHFQQLYQAAGFRPVREIDATRGPDTLAQIAAGRGATVMPAAFARQRYPGVVARRLLDEVYIDLHLVLSDALEPAWAQALGRHAGLLATALA